MSSLRSQRRRVIAAATAAATAAVLTACTSGRRTSPAGSTAAAAGGRAGAAVLTLAGRTLELSIRRCVHSGATSVNLTAVDPRTEATLVVNLAQPVNASTLVYTTRRTDNSFTNYALASTVVHGQITGALSGTQLLLSGRAAKQAYRPDGKPAGTATDEDVALHATCQVIQPAQAPPSYARRPAHGKEGHHKPHGSPNR
jgi:hypothetical protein